MTWDLIAIGNPVYDDIQTPHISTSGRVLSGCSTNACLAAAKLGLKKVGLIGTVGPDFKTQFIKDLEQYNIVPAKILDAPETGGFGLIYKEDGDRTLSVLGQANQVTIDALTSDVLDAKMIAIGPILGEVPVELLEHIIEHSKAEIFIDPQGFIREIQPNRQIKRIARGNIAQILAKTATYLKPNEHEADILWPSLNHRQTAEQFVKDGAKFGIVTLAHNGSIITDGNETWKIPPFPTTAKDPTGAGDTYMGSYIFSKLTRKGNFVDHAVFASAAASCMVEHTGPSFSMTNSEVLRRVDQIKDDVIQIK